jgi:hypothetical protein
MKPLSPLTPQKGGLHSTDAKVVRSVGGSAQQVVKLGRRERIRRTAPGGELLDEEQLLAVSDGTATCG